MKTILLWDPRFPDRRPARLTLEDSVAAAAVRSGVATAANPLEAGLLSAGGPLDPTMLTEVIIQHGYANATRRVVLPYSVVMVGALAGVMAAIGTPIAAGVTPTPTPTPGETARFGSITMSGEPSYAVVGQPFNYIGPGQISGGTAPYTYALNGTMPDGLKGFTSGRGALPAGLIFNPSTGAITGTPTANGFFWGWITATDSTGKKGVLTIALSTGPAAVAVPPSGDVTGVTDVANINAVTQAGGRARLDGIYYQNASYRLAANAGLVLANGFESRLIGQTIAPMVRNNDQATQARNDTNLMVWAEGTAFFNGKFGRTAGQMGDRAAITTQNCGMYFVSADGVLIKGVKTIAECMNVIITGSTHVFCRDHILSSDGVINQDGFDIFNGSSNVAVKRVSGRVDDDVFSWAAKTAQSATSIVGSGTAWSDGAHVHSIFLEDATVEARDENWFRLQRGNTYELRNIRFRNLEALTAGAPSAYRLMTIGRRTYVTGALTDPSIPWDIEGENLKGFDVWINPDSDVNGVRLRKIIQSRQLICGVGTQFSESSTYLPDVRNILIEDVTDTFNGLHSTVLSMPVGSALNGLSLKNIALNQLARFDNSPGAMQNVTIDGIAIGTPTSPMFSGNTASTGMVSNFVITNPLPVTYGVAVGYKLGANAPKVRPYDTTPAAVLGSAATFTNGTTLNGTKMAQGGAFVADGMNWARSGAATNVPYPDAKVFYMHTLTGAPGTSLASLPAEIGGAYAGLTGSTNTTPPRVNDAGDGIYAGAATNGYRAGAASPGLNQRIRGKTKFKGAGPDNLGIGLHTVAGSLTGIFSRYNSVGGTGGLGALELIALVNNAVPTGMANPIASYDLAATTYVNDREFGFTSVVDDPIDPTKRTVRLLLEMVPVGPAVDVTAPELLKVGSGPTANGGAPAIRYGAVQGGATRRHFSQIIAETI